MKHNFNLRKGIFMKFGSIMILLLAALSAHAETTCSSENNGDGPLLTSEKQELMLKDVQADDIYLFADKEVKVVNFYTTGGPEQGITVKMTSGEKFDIWCSDEETPADD
jgi:hypothetical protein